MRLTKAPAFADILDDALAARDAKVVDTAASEPLSRKLRELRKSFIDYYKSPEKFLDFSTLRDRGDGEYYVEGKSFQEVTGLSRLGSGAFANVYAIDERRVLKVIKTSDSGYAKFVRLVRANPGNPHLPRIYYSGEWAGKQVYILERLEDMSSPDVRVNPFSRRGDTINEYFRDAIRRGAGDNPFVTLATEHLREAARLLDGLTDDLHSGNVMFRVNADGSRTAVVTDPSSAQSDHESFC